MSNTLLDLRHKKDVLHFCKEYNLDYLNTFGNGLLYLVQSDFQRSKNVFKFGTCESLINFQGRLSNYNSGRLPEEFMRPVYIFRCNNKGDGYKIEKKIKELFSKDIAGSELYFINEIEIFVNCVLNLINSRFNLIH